MKKVDIIHGGWLKAPNGASSVLRTLAESTSKFEEYGIQLSVYSMDLIVLKSFENIAAINQRNGLRYFIKKNANANSILAFIYICGMLVRLLNIILIKGLRNRESCLYMIFLHVITI